MSIKPNWETFEEHYKNNRALLESKNPEVAKAIRQASSSTAYLFAIPLIGFVGLIYLSLPLQDGTYISDNFIVPLICLEFILFITCSAIGTVVESNSQKETCKIEEDKQKEDNPYLQSLLQKEKNLDRFNKRMRGEPEEMMPKKAKGG